MTRIRSDRTQVAGSQRFHKDSMRRPSSKFNSHRLLRNDSLPG